MSINCYNIVLVKRIVIKLFKIHVLNIKAIDPGLCELFAIFRTSIG